MSRKVSPATPQSPAQSSPVQSQGKWRLLKETVQYQFESSPDQLHFEPKSFEEFQSSPVQTLKGPVEPGYFLYC